MSDPSSYKPHASSVIGAICGTLIAIYAAYTEPPTTLTRNLLVATATITVVVDRLWERFWGWLMKFRELRSIDKAELLLDEKIRNPNTPKAHKAKFLDKKLELGMRRIDATIVNAEPPKSQTNTANPATNLTAPPPTTGQP